jgi:hypothetical protein
MATAFSSSAWTSSTCQIGEDGRACVEVHVTARDLNANVLFDEKAGHVFQIEDGLIRRFDIRRVEARRNGASPPRP